MVDRNIVDLSHNGKRGQSLSETLRASHLTGGVRTTSPTSPPTTHLARINSPKSAFAHLGRQLSAYTSWKSIRCYNATTTEIDPDVTFQEQ
jgi:hypothetical protein